MYPTLLHKTIRAQVVVVGLDLVFLVMDLVPDEAQVEEGLVGMVPGEARVAAVDLVEMVLDAVQVEEDLEGMILGEELVVVDLVSLTEIALSLHHILSC